MRTGDLTPEWDSSPICVEMRVRIRQCLTQEHDDSIGIGIVKVPQDMYDEILEYLPEKERVICRDVGGTHIMFLGWMVEPY